MSDGKCSCDLREQCQAVTGEMRSSAVQPLEVWGGCSAVMEEGGVVR